MATQFAYVTHETPSTPTRDTATKRVYKDRPVHSYAVGGDRPTAKQATLALRAARRVADGIKGRR